MADVAQMRFRSTSAPQQFGVMALSEEGTFRIVPSDEFRDEMARLEEIVLKRSQTFGIRAGIGLITLGAVTVGIGWFLGRIFGKLGSTLSQPRPVQNMTLTWDPNGALRVTLRGLESRLQTIQMAWNPDEFLQPEAEEFVAKYEAMRRSGTPPALSQMTKDQE